jgi:site-specific DNA-methyltransferase (adenine-specific)
MTYRIYNEDCIEGCKKHIDDNTTDLIITDPPYGIEGDKFEKHYARDENFVVDGYIEIPKAKYNEFSHSWIKQAERILKPGGSIYVVSGYTNLFDILEALRSTSLEEVNHIIWKYNFGVHTTKKYVSSHYHILYWVKPGKKPTFNTYSRFGQTEKDFEKGSLNYQDREDVWIINKEYKQGKNKNINELPTELLIKIIQYSSNKNDTICDPFLGGFSTAIVSIGMNRKIVGFEKSENIYNHGMSKIESIKPGFILPKLREPKKSELFNQGKPWTKEEKIRLCNRYVELIGKEKTKAKVIERLTKEFGRGRFSLMNKLKNFDKEYMDKMSKESNKTITLENF